MHVSQDNGMVDDIMIFTKTVEKLMRVIIEILVLTYSFRVEEEMYIGMSEIKNFNLMSS